MKHKFVCLFHESENIYLTKDVGVIPYVLPKELKYDCNIICYKNEYWKSKILMLTSKSESFGIVFTEAVNPMMSYYYFKYGIFL